MPTEAPSVLRGVITPVVTAVTSGRSIDRASQEAVCAHQLKAGADGIFVAGTTGEGATLDTALLGELVDVTVGFVAGQVPVLVGALAPGTAGVIERAQDRRADHLYLSVFTENHRARRFYEKYGFEPEGTYAFMVGNHADEDIVMRLKL